jgi:prefoldin subunit 5
MSEIIKEKLERIQRYKDRIEKLKGEYKVIRKLIATYKPCLAERPYQVEPITDEED